jgi:hypothetical protein
VKRQGRISPSWPSGRTRGLALRRRTRVAPAKGGDLTGRVGAEGDDGPPAGAGRRRGRRAAPTVEADPDERAALLPVGERRDDAPPDEAAALGEVGDDLRGRGGEASVERDEQLDERRLEREVDAVEPERRRRPAESSDEVVFRVADVQADADRGPGRTGGGARLDQDAGELPAVRLDPRPIGVQQPVVRPLDRGGEAVGERDVGRGDRRGPRREVGWERVARAQQRRDRERLPGPIVPGAAAAAAAGLLPLRDQDEPVARGAGVDAAQRLGVRRIDGGEHLDRSEARAGPGAEACERHAPTFWSAGNESRPAVDAGLDSRAIAAGLPM